MSTSVLQLISSFGFFGAEGVVLELSKELSRVGIDLYVGVFRNRQNPHTEVANGAKGYGLKTGVFPCNGRFDPKTVFLIREFAKEKGIDLIHSHGYKANFYSAMAASFTRLPLITTCHNWIGTGFKMKFYERLDKIILRRFNKVIAVSDEIKREILNLWLPKSKVSVISNGIDLNRFEGIGNNKIREELKIDPHCKVVGTIGRLTEEKGHIYLLQTAKEVLKRFSDAIFLIIGSGSLKEELEDQAKAMGLENKVIFTGVRRDIPEILNSIDVFVLPSLIEGLPMVLLEAMAAQKPIIATKVGEIPKILEQGKLGFLVKPKDVRGLADAIVSVLKDNDKINKISRKLYNKVRDNYSSEKMAERYLRVYQEILRNKKIFPADNHGYGQVKWKKTDVP